MSDLIKPYTIQSKTLIMEGSPEGLVAGEYGLLVLDVLTATYWIKHSGLEKKTGWVIVNGAGLVQIILGALGFYTAKSIAEIKAIPTSTNNRFCAYNGFVSGGDNGGSGIFTWDPLSIEADNSFSCLQPVDQGSNPMTPGRFVQTPAS